MLKIFSVVALAITICGCSTTTPEQRLAANQGACTGYGFKAGTDAYAACMMQMDLADQEDDYRRRQALADGLSEMGQSMQRNRPVTCNTYGSARNTFGNTVYGNSTTTCY